MTITAQQWHVAVGQQQRRTLRHGQALQPRDSPPADAGPRAPSSGREGLPEWAAPTSDVRAAFRTALSQPLRGAGHGRWIRPPRLAGARTRSTSEIVGEEMQFVEIELDPGETVVAEAGRHDVHGPVHRPWTRSSETAPSRSRVFLGKALSAGKRALTGESLFMTHFTALRLAGRASVAFASPYPGKIIPLDAGRARRPDALPEGRLPLRSEAAPRSASRSTRSFGVGLFGGEGFILQTPGQGDGMAFVHAGGTIVERELRSGRDAEARHRLPRRASSPRVEATTSRW